MYTPIVAFCLFLRVMWLYLTILHTLKFFLLASQIVKENKDSPLMTKAINQMHVVAFMIAFGYKIYFITDYFITLNIV